MLAAAMEGQVRVGASRAGPDAGAHRVSAAVPEWGVGGEPRAVPEGPAECRQHLRQPHEEQPRARPQHHQRLSSAVPLPVHQRHAPPAAGAAQPAGRAQTYVPPSPAHPLSWSRSTHWCGVCPRPPVTSQCSVRASCTGWRRWVVERSWDRDAPGAAAFQVPGQVVPVMGNVPPSTGRAAKGRVPQPQCQPHPVNKPSRGRHPSSPCDAKGPTLSPQYTMKGCRTSWRRSAMPGGR